MKIKCKMPPLWTEIVPEHTKWSQDDWQGTTGIQDWGRSREPGVYICGVKRR